MQNEYKENRMFEEMLKAARLKLAGRSAEEISEKTKIVFDKETSGFYLKSLGKDVEISYPEFEFSSEIQEWHALTILHYMDMSNGTLPFDSIISFSQLKNGMIRGGGFDRRVEQVLERLTEEMSEEQIVDICLKMDGKIIKSNADLCVVFDYLPLYPVMLKIWFADEEFPGTGRMFLDKSADAHLTVEDAVTVGEMILEELQAR